MAKQPRAEGGRFGSDKAPEVATDDVKAATSADHKAELHRENAALRERVKAAEGSSCVSCGGKMTGGKLRPASDGGTPSEPRGGTPDDSTGSDRQEPATEPVEDDADSDGLFDYL